MEAMSQSMTLEGDIDVTVDDVPTSVHVQPSTGSNGPPQATATATVTASPPATATAASAAPAAATSSNLSRPRRSCVSRAPSRASQRSVTFSLHTPSRNHESTYEESSQFNPAQLDTLSLGTRRNSQIHASQSNLSTNGGAMLVYDQQHPGIRSGYPLGPFDPIPTLPGSVWYPMPPPPMPVYFCAPPQIDPKVLRQAMKQAAKAEKHYQTKQKPVSPCKQFCCGGFARVLWLIIAIVLFGCIGIIIVSIAHI